MPHTLESPNPYVSIAGIHGPPEITGLALHASMEQDPIAGWDSIIANEEAVALGVRLVSRNMALCMPGIRGSKDGALHRAAEVYDIVNGRPGLEIHDRPDATGEYVVIGGTYRAELLGMAALLGIFDVVDQSRLPRLSSLADNILTVEMCRDQLGDSERRVAHNVERLRECMVRIAAGDIPEVDESAFTFYEYIDEIEVTRAAALGLVDGLRLGPFDPLPDYVRERLGLPPEDEYVVEIWNSPLSNPGWYGGVLRKIDGTSLPAEIPTERADAADILPRISHSAPLLPAGVGAIAVPPYTPLVPAIHE